jgi:ABC-type polysaccharide/polyol phosphate transport system ATPase subunit
MSDCSIKVTSLSKKYRLGLRKKRAETLAGQIANVIKSPWQNLERLKDLNRFASEDESVFWALNDVSFEVKEGEVLGIIGKNGAGKSTLLKILSQITEPTSGKIEIHGRVASLLEVGTGFHPELSGRENIYMNGTILGMTRREIDSKLDEIIDFSGVEKFIDTPVKFYSSGMKVRLGFSVAAHLDPEILIIDEVLAVGDYEFQKKCLGKMEDVANQGRTVLFVSHNLQAVSSLTNKSILLVNGLIDKIGPTSNVVDYYLSRQISSELKYMDDTGAEIRVDSVEIKTSLSNNIHFHGDDLRLEFLLFSSQPLKNAALSYQIINSENVSVLHVLNLSSEVKFLEVSGFCKLVSILPKVQLYPDKYRIKVHFADSSIKKKFQTIEDICPFEVQLKEGVREYYWYKGHAIYVAPNIWQSCKR